MNQDMRSKSGPDGLQVGDPPLAGRYVLRELLGAGSFGVVYRAHDSHRDEEVAVKLLRMTTPEDIRLLKKEFRTVRNLAHPHLVTLRDLHQEGDLCFFTMDSLPGKSLDQFLPERPTITLIESVCRILADVASGLWALHSCGIVHRDLKPTNVIVTTEGVGVVLDFGLASRVENPIAARGRSGFFTGSPGYASPEQSIGDDNPGPASDLFSLGVVLYEAIERRLPFEHFEIALAASCEAQPEVAFGKSWPTDLKALVAELLSFSPDKRGNALDVERRLRQIAIGVSGASTVRGQVARPEVFVGRTTELTAVDAFLAKRGGREAVPVALISGAAGIGKSTFIAEVARRREARGEIVLRGTCHVRERVAFNAFDGVVDDIVRLVRIDGSDGLVPRDGVSLCGMFPAFREIFPSAKDRSDSETESQDASFEAFVELLERLGQRAPVLVVIDDLQWADADSCRLLARLGETTPRNWVLIGSRRAPNASERELHDEGGRSAALSQFHARQRSGLGPQLVPSSAPAGRSKPQRPIGTTSTAQFAVEDPEVVLESVLGAAPEIAALGPLGPADSEALSRALANEFQLSEPDVIELARLSEGVPLWLRFAAFARHRTDGDGARSAGTMGEMLSAAVNGLVRSTREMLLIVLASSHPVPATIARQAWPHNDNFEHVVGELVSRGLARREPYRDDWAIGTYHNLVRDHLEHLVVGDAGRAVHERLADAHAKLGDDTRPFARVEHEALAGRPREAVDCAVAAAERAMTSFAYNLAASLLAQAITQHRAVSNPTVDEAELHIRHGRALIADGRSIAGARAVLHGIELRVAASGALDTAATSRQKETAGRGPQAEAAREGRRQAADDELRRPLGDATDTATSPRAFPSSVVGESPWGRQWRTRHMFYAAEHLLRGGARDEGAAIMRAALDLEGISWHRSVGRTVGSILWNRARLRVSRWLRRNYETPGKPSPEQGRTLDALWSAGVGLSYYEPLHAFDYQARHARLAEVARDPGHLARAHATEAMLSGLSRGPEADVDAARHYGLAVMLAQRSQQPEVEAHVRSMGTAFAYNSWTFDAAIARARETVAFCKEFCPRARWEIAGATWLEACAQGKLGRLVEQGETAARGLREAHRLGDRYQQITLDMGPSTLYRLAADQPDEAIANADMARTLCGESGFLEYLHAYTIVRCHLYSGQPALAREAARRAWAEIERTRMHGIAIIRVEMLDLLARVEIANADLDGAARWTKRLLRVAHPAARAQGKFLTALIHQLRGDGDEARRDFAEAAVALDGLALQPEGKLARILSGAEDIEVKTAAAIAVLAAHQVRRPSAYLAMMAPGLERELTKPEHRSDGN